MTGLNGIRTQIGSYLTWTYLGLDNTKLKLFVSVYEQITKNTLVDVFYILIFPIVERILLCSHHSWLLVLKFKFLKYKAVAITIESSMLYVSFSEIQFKRDSFKYEDV